MEIATPFRPLLRADRLPILRSLLVLNILGLWAMFFSGQWDAAEHAKGAVDRFWYPPHYGIYFSLLVALIMSGIGLLLVLRGPGLPFEKLRANAALTLLVAANAINFSGAPFDAWWHTTFGLDLTVWSPPHLHIMAGATLSALVCAVYFLDDEAHAAALRPLRWNGRHDVAFWSALLAGILVSVFLVFEYESNRLSREVLARPIWTYPLLWPLLATCYCALSVALTRRIGAATVMGGLYVLARLAIFGFDQIVLDYNGGWFYPLIVPALAFDLTLWLGRRREQGRSQGWLIAAAGLASAVVLCLTTPLFWSLLGGDGRLRVTPWISYWPLGLLGGVLGALLGWWIGMGLRRLRPCAQQAHPSVLRPAVEAP
ncbi:hypothetical protein [Kallotenue papyrolyticum]|uniref:hypothetical protein n=1 Tax=Kallotenue papyrolyticum TaxID=1325125 RepID=UPI00047191C3|nr:hypothetical protein [Kallotenue papyrolyticum]